MLFQPSSSSSFFVLPPCFLISFLRYLAFVCPRLMSAQFHPVVFLALISILPQFPPFVCLPLLMLLQPSSSSFPNLSQVDCVSYSLQSATFSTRSSLFPAPFCFPKLPESLIVTLPFIFLNPNQNNAVFFPFFIEISNRPQFLELFLVSRFSFPLFGFVPHVFYFHFALFLPTQLIPMISSLLLQLHRSQFLHNFAQLLSISLKIYT